MCRAGSYECCFERERKSVVVEAERGGDDHLRCDFRKSAKLLAPMWRALGREFWTPGVRAG